jgi:hypothetical protein
MNAKILLLCLKSNGKQRHIPFLSHYISIYCNQHKNINKARDH